MQISELKTLAEIYALEALQRAAWGASDLEIVPSHLFHAGADHGSCLLGGYEEDRLVAFVYAFPTGGDCLYSHIACVHPELQGRGLGVILKQAQANWARARGFARISWTFDPLQSRNCRLNLHRLGATSNRYLVDYYGELDDDLNRGIPSDRLEVDWWLDGRERPKRRESFGFPLEMTREERSAWRQRQRAYLQDAFARGLSVIDFERGDDCRMWLG